MTGYLELVGKITTLLVQEKDITEKYEDVSRRIDEYRRDQYDADFNERQEKMKVLDAEQLPLKYERTKIINERKLLSVELGVITNLCYLQQMELAGERSAIGQKHDDWVRESINKQNEIFAALLVEIRKHNEVMEANS